MSKIFENRTKAIRKWKQILQRELALVSEIASATYCKIEKDQRCSKRDQATILSGLLEIDLKELAGLCSAGNVCGNIEEDANPVLALVSEEILIINEKLPKYETTC
jgi:DNA-binding XRE family transcriptional regulator